MYTSRWLGYATDSRMEMFVSAAAFSFLWQKRAKGKVISRWDFFFSNFALPLFSFFHNYKGCSWCNNDKDYIRSVYVCLVTQLKRFLLLKLKKGSSFSFLFLSCLLFRSWHRKHIEGCKDAWVSIVTHWTQVEIRVSSLDLNAWWKRMYSSSLYVWFKRRKKRKPEGINERQMLLCHACVFLEQHQE